VCAGYSLYRSVPQTNLRIPARFVGCVTGEATSPSRPCTIQPTDDPLLDMIECVARDVLAKIGDDPDARFAFFKEFVALAKRFADCQPSSH
jgi:hypothetical protein